LSFPPGWPRLDGGSGNADAAAVALSTSSTGTGGNEMVAKSASVSQARPEHATPPAGGSSSADYWVVVETLRPIAPGEELLIDYTSLAPPEVAAACEEGGGGGALWAVYLWARYRILPQ
jgi:hypothetical protein